MKQVGDDKTFPPQTFTAWVNSHLRKAGTQIENIEEDFRYHKPQSFTCMIAILSTMIYHDFQFLMISLKESP